METGTMFVYGKIQQIKQQIKIPRRHLEDLSKLTLKLTWKGPDPEICKKKKKKRK